MNYTLLTNLIRLPATGVMRSFDALVGVFAGSKPVLSQSEFPFHRVLYDNRHIFLQEYNALIEKKTIYSGTDFFKTANEKKVNNDANWKVYPILLFNYIFKENAEECPQTFKILSALPGCCCIMYSILGPGKHAPPHRGIYRGVYRCLFILSMAEGGDCWITIDGTKIYFKEGESVVFDETALHEVKNNTPVKRVAIFLDLYRKLPFPLNIANNILYFILRKSPYALSLMNAYKQLENTTFIDFKPKAPELC